MHQVREPAHTMRIWLTSADRTNSLSPYIYFDGFYPRACVLLGSAFGRLVQMCHSLARFYAFANDKPKEKEANCGNVCDTHTDNLCEPQ